MFSKVLIANRGAIASRLIRTLRRMKVGSVAVYSEADRHSLYVEQADEAVPIGPAPATLSYLSIPALVDAARKTGAEAIHPGYGFLSENADFAETCAKNGVVFVGPTPEQIRAFGFKHTARKIALENGLPVFAATGLLQSAEEACAAAAAIGYPVMLKSIAGGGGIGMRVCQSSAKLAEAFDGAQRLSHSSFSTGGLYLEKFISKARHIEVQIFGDGARSVVALGERDCSAQRRHQKVIEETPAPQLGGEARAKLLAAAVRLGKAVRYLSAGTVEFLYEADSGAFYFLEVNTRLQVEHGVTEEVTDVDLVEWMLRQAAGEMPRLDELYIEPSGCSIEARIYAEDPARDFQPSPGTLSQVAWPEAARVETWVESGSEVTPYYDPMLAKIIVHAADRPAALKKLGAALAECRLSGIETNLEYLRQICDDPEFQAGGITTSYLRTLSYRRRDVEVVESGTQTTIQDFPGRLGYWHVGVPPSGPMDSLAFRLANRLIGNPEDAPGLEFAVTGPVLRLSFDTTIALTGADFEARLNGEPLCRWKATPVRAGSLLELGRVIGSGSRGYLSVLGGFDVPDYLGSRSTFILGRFGGHCGRALRAGDILHVALHGQEPDSDSPARQVLHSALIPQYGPEWEIGVLYGPHGAPDFFTAEDIEMFFSTSWKVHYNSDRTGVRLIGPKPIWARKDGGEAGLHPSNIHDNAYAVGTVDFTGDMPVILGPDGPSLGGFVCPATVVEGERWKIGQLKPGDRVRFRAISLVQAVSLEEELDTSIETLAGALPRLPPSSAVSGSSIETPILGQRPGVVCRADGDRCLLVEYGPNVLDLDLRFRVHALENRLRHTRLSGILEITPGVRSLHIRYDSRRLKRETLLEAVDSCEAQITDLDDIVVASRVVYLPLCWDDPATQLAIRKYMQSVRPDAPWCPSNIEFIRRINGLSSIDEVRHIVFGASYLVLGLGDVYLGAPVATPLDPRHRLVTTKYNPARTWTPENAVGIGGAYLCVYGMEGPGGYQFVGRTLQMWNTYHSTREFEPGTPWLLRFFDQIRFEPVSAARLLEIREAFPHGGYALHIEPESFRLRDYHAFISSTEKEAAAFKKRQQAAFVAERERWATVAADQFPDRSESEPDVAPPDLSVPDGCRPVCSPLTASVWKIAVETGQQVQAGQRLVVLEAMKMEIAVVAPAAGVIERLNCGLGALVSPGQQLVTLRGEVSS
jgi:urea carboxylase